LTGLVSTYIEHFTYAGLFGVLLLCGLGLPLPEDMALLAGGFLAHRGVTQLPMTLAVSMLGVVAGDNCLFFMGRRFGTGLVSYVQLGRPSSQVQIDRLREFMHRHGNRAIFYARFLIGLRAFIYLTAGSLGFSPGKFVFYDLLGAAISVPIVVSLGYHFGGQIEEIFRYLGGFEHLIWIVALGSLIVYASRSLIFARERGADST
jgi:membrane protein DedA with SNARE-associated domain